MKKMFVVVILLMITLTMTACQKEKLSKLDKIINENNYIILDVRTNMEYKNGHIKGSVNIPYDKIDEKTKLDKNKTIIVYCQSGRRSNIAKENLEKLSYKVYDAGAYEKIDLEKEK